jgi:transposase
MRVARPLRASPEQVTRLREWARGTVSDPRVTRRARIVLAALDGHTNQGIARQERCTEKTVRSWRGRFADGGPDALNLEAPRPGRPRKFSRSVEATIAGRASMAVATGASLRTAASALGVPTTTLWRVIHRSGHRGGWRPRSVVDYLALTLGLSKRQVARKYVRGLVASALSEKALRTKSVRGPRTTAKGGRRGGLGLMGPAARSRLAEGRRRHP